MVRIIPPQPPTIGPVPPVTVTNIQPAAATPPTQPVTAPASGTPVTSSPMSREAAIKLIDERAQAAHEHYALLRNELAWPTEEAAEPAVAMPPVPPPVD